ncbi:hypothetical protein PPL_04921 [Heterostelium album PN500]|uniref:Uncharacterized protein n=1 Tax=Heterostelium pallidum (strain ATCC 26659 / Pp 5 / PN500) TaxID=670386 RepID=D3B8X8_HETP5|nr:hypothetical protein PPL_04921 [Heterostelium album PN500]EFA82496.1 hypothetical protein PPL_04921 [Heterostelium album PN500]|eukprot:XP_020434613.1 hypothetical protein PPL_04921 [Heterostelium album PN500]
MILTIYSAFDNIVKLIINKSNNLILLLILALSIDMNLDFKCSEHQRSFENICFKCNLLLCSRYNNNSFINNRIKDIWTTIKSSSTHYQKLSKTENDISRFFKELHDYLIEKERSLTKEIINDKQIIINQIESNINELKQISNIFKINNRIQNINNNHIKSTDPPSNQEDTTTRYSTRSIIESINQCSTLISFIQSNSDTIFNQYTLDINHDNHYDLKDILSQQYNNDTDSMLLDSIYKINNNINNSTKSIINFKQQSISDYYFKSLSKDKLENDLYKFFKSSIDLHTLPFEQPQLIFNNKINNTKHTYIFSTHSDNGATLFDITNNSTEPSVIHKIKHSHFDFQDSPVIQVGDTIYSFNIEKRIYFTYSITTKQMKISEMDYDHDISNITLSYDGKDHIYLMCVNKYIIGFNIHTLMFQNFFIGYLTNNLHWEDYDEGVFIPSILSFWYKSKLYTFSESDNYMSIYDPTKDEIEDIDMPSEMEYYCACTDGNGNVYFYTNNKTFHRFNVDTLKMVDLKSNHQFPNSLLYHKFSDEQSYIYVLRGNQYNKENQRYSIENDQWEIIFTNDDYYTSIDSFCLLYSYYCFIDDCQARDLLVDLLIGLYDKNGSEIIAGRRSKEVERFIPKKNVTPKQRLVLRRRWFDIYPSTEQTKRYNLSICVSASIIGSNLLEK